MPEPVIDVTAVVMCDPAGRLLTVRKAGTSMFMNPGGKPESGESPRACGVRECREELGVELSEDALVEFGHIVTQAANEPGHTLRAWVFEHPYVPGIAPSAEIAEVRWQPLDVDPLPSDLAPLIVGHVAPALVRRGPDAVGRVE